MTPFLSAEDDVFLENEESQTEMFKTRKKCSCK